MCCGNCHIDPGRCPGTLGLLVAPRSSGCSMKAVVLFLFSWRFIASKEKSARVFPSPAFRFRGAEFHVKPRRHLADLKGKGPLSLAQGALLKVEQGGVITKASALPSSMTLNHFFCTSGLVKSARRLCRRSSSTTSIVSWCFLASFCRCHATEFFLFSPEKMYRTLNLFQPAPAVSSGCLLWPPHWYMG